MKSLRVVTGHDHSRQLQRTPLPAQVLEILREEIITGIWPPGIRLPEAALCERFGVSRTPLREALKALEAEGLVDLLPNRGAIVTQVTITDVEQKLQVLRALEILAIDLACKAATDEEMEAVVDHHPNNVHGSRDFYFGDLDVHRAIVEASHNTTLISMHRVLHRHVQRVRHLTDLPKGLGTEGLDDHDKIVSALNARDAAKAQAVMGINYRSAVAEGLARQTARSIREAILQGGLNVDDRLPSEEELAAKFGTSRPTIREALKRLAAQNLIRSQRESAGGTFVARPSFDEACGSISTATTFLASIGEFDLLEIAEARAEFEGMCCKLAAANRSDEDLAALAREIDLQEDKSLDDWDFCQSDVRFHRQIALATRNQVLILTMRSIFEALHPAANMTAVRYLDRDVIIGFHRRLQAAIAARDAEAARATVGEQMAYHLSTFVQARDERRRRGEIPVGRPEVSEGPR